MRACLLISVLVLAGCASQTRVVLLPDADGRTGQVSVQNEAGRLTLQQAGQSASTGMGGLNLNQQDLRALQSRHAGVFAAEPLPPQSRLLYFPSGAAETSDGTKVLLADVRALAREREPYQISVIGHTDSEGAAAHNRKLSQARALWVRQLLIRGGLDPRRIQTSYHGQNDPLVRTRDGVPERRNRRVEVMVR